jgi:hypothetical protein
MAARTTRDGWERSVRTATVRSTTGFTEKRRTGIYNAPLVCWRTPDVDVSLGITLQPAVNGFQGEERSDHSPRMPERLEAFTTTLCASGAARRSTFSAHTTLAKGD